MINRASGFIINGCCKGGRLTQPMGVDLQKLAEGLKR